MANPIPVERQIQGSGDLVADRRYSYAVAAERDGDHVAAADLYRQTLEIVPHWLPARLALARAEIELGREEDARANLRMVAGADPDDLLGARAYLARLGDPAGTLSAGYVAALFDDYAPRFDEHLTGALHYRVPDMLADLVRARDMNRRFELALDLGCGTGLMARALRDAVQAFEGVDLSPRMVAEACETGLYRNLAVGEAAAWLGGYPPGAADLVLAADVFCYIEDLAPLLAAARRAMARDGLLAFSIQTGPESGWRVGEDLRVHHSVPHIADLARDAHLEIRESKAVTLRLDRGQPVAGALFLLAPAG